MVWCSTCERVWRVSDLAGEPPDRRCPITCCSDGPPGGLLPYHEVRRLAAIRWPRSPEPGRHYALRTNNLG